MSTPLSGDVIVTSPGPATVVVSAPSPGQVATSPGVPGPPGAGVELEGAVETYADLPGDLGVDDAGAAYVVQESGKLYVWSGYAWPIEANGADFRGEPGRGISGITIVGNDLRFAMSDASNESVTVPALTAAAASATAASASATAASGSATAAAGSAIDANAAKSDAVAAKNAAQTAQSAAETAATNASGSATTASGAATTATNAKNDAVTAKNAAETAATNSGNSATAAAGSATAADDSADAAAASASAAAGSATNAATSATNAGNSQTAAAGSASSASTSATSASGSATSASVSAGAAATSASTAQDAADAAEGSATSAAASASSANASAVSASGSASTATTQAGNAASGASAAAGSASAAAGSASDAADSAETAEYWANEAAEAVTSGIPNANATTKGGIMLPGSVPGELGGTYDHPTVTGWADKADLVAGKIPVSQIPAQATNERHVVANTAARLALTTAQVQPGDMAIQTGNPGRGTYILNGPDPSVEGNWVLMVNPDAPVSSVNGYSGIVVLGKTDVGLGNVDNTADSAKPVSAAQQAALDGKANTAHAHAASDITSGTLDVARLPVGTSGSQVAAGNDSRITGAVQTSRTISTTGGLSGGGNLSTNRTITIEDGGIVKAKLASGVQASLDKADTALQSVTIPADMSVIAFGKDTVRAAGLGDNPFGVKLRRAVRIKTVHFRCLTADASGNLVVRLVRNGGAITISAVTIAAANQVAGAVSGTLDVDCSAGDIITVEVTGIGATPGKGLVADIEAVVI